MKKITSSLPDDVNNFIITMMFDRISLKNTDFISIGNLVIQYNTIQCESLVGQVAHPIFFICGRASLLVGAFTQVSRCSWIVGYCAFGL